MQQFTPEQMIDFLGDYTSQSELEDVEINSKAVNSFLQQYNMRVIKRDKHFDYIFYSTKGDYSVNFSLDKDSLNQSNTNDILELFYFQKD